MVAGSHQVSSHDHWCTSSTWEPSRRGSTLRNLTTSAFWSKFWSAADSLVYSYRRSFTGFAAKLTHQEQQKIASMESVVSVLESKIYKLHTTRSWDFMGFPDTVRRNLMVESDVIIGMFDTGVWPESESFSHVVLGPPPKRWKGTCQSSGNFSCNNKLIGARLYPNLPSPNDSAREVEGHGTHTASTAAGREVNGVSLFGLTEGNARGAVPSARIAVYKVCWSNGSAFHIVSWLHSMMPLPMASTLSLFLWAQKLRLGNGQTFLGSTVNTFKSGRKMHPLIYGEDAARICDEEKAQSCFDGCLDEKAVKGKIVFCDAV